MAAVSGVRTMAATLTHLALSDISEVDDRDTVLYKYYERPNTESLFSRAQTTATIDWTKASGCRQFTWDAGGCCSRLRRAEDGSSRHPLVALGVIHVSPRGKRYMYIHSIAAAMLLIQTQHKHSTSRSPSFENEIDKHGLATDHD